MQISIEEGSRCFDILAPIIERVTHVLSDELLDALHTEAGHRFDITNQDDSAVRVGDATETEIIRRLEAKNDPLYTLW